MKDAEKRLEGYQRLIDITRDLASTLDPDILFDHIIHAAADITDAEAASVLLYDAAIRQLYFQVATNLDMQAMRGLAVPLEGSIAGWVVSNREPARIAHAYQDTRFHPKIEQVTSSTTESILGVPLIYKEKVVGVLEVFNKHNTDFTEADEDLLQVLAAQAAVVIENKHLFEQSDLIAGFVHELRTPLAYISNATYLLSRPEISPEQREQVIHNIHFETQQLSTLASSFLDLARLESGRVQFHLTEFKLQPLLEQCRQAMQNKAEENQVSISIEFPEDFPVVEADREKIKQVVLILISNAIQYNVPNGSVRIMTGFDQDKWMLTVGDTGVGIPEKALSHIFEKFYRVKASEGKVPGTRLSLSICKQIVSGHGGNITVRSKSGEGTEFTINIPTKKK